MKNKFRIVTLKILMLWPIGVIIAMLLSGLMGDLIWAIAGGLVISAGFIFWNVFEYDKYDSMGSEDYLESSHSLKLPNTKAVLEMIDNQTKGAFADVILTDRMDEHKYWLFDIEKANRDSIMHVDFSSEDIVVTIKAKYLKFIPDFAKNYCILHRLRKAAEEIVPLMNEV